MSMLDYFASGIQVQLFYALAVTLIVYSIPSADLNYIIDFRDSPANADLGELSTEFGSSFNQQAGFGVVDVAALVLFSGNMVLDLILNFFTAIPSIVTLLLKAVFLFISIDPDVQNTILAYVYVIITVAYVIALLNFLLNVRSQTRGVI